MRKNIIFTAIGLLLLFSSYAAIQMMVPLPIGNRPIEVEIKRGISFKQAVELLSDNGMIRDSNLFLILGRITGLDRKLKAGYYPLWGTMSPFDVFLALRRGHIIEYAITIIEGDTLMEIAEKLSSKGIISTEEFYKLAGDKGFLYALDIDAPSIEGYIFPETYRFPKGIKKEEILMLMVDKLREKYNEELMHRTFELGLTEREVLTIASIIEKEAVTDDERSIISAVYHNRLRRGMPLQADPTAIYGVKSSKEKITKKDLVRKTSHNTYVLKGLPPGPIASPGLKSIIAALNPAKVPYLYFVAKNDGTHHFSVTAAEHLEAVKMYRRGKG